MMSNMTDTTEISVCIFFSALLPKHLTGCMTVNLLIEHFEMSVYYYYYIAPVLDIRCLSCVNVQGAMLWDLALLIVTM